MPLPIRTCILLAVMPTLIMATALPIDSARLEAQGSRDLQMLPTPVPAELPGYKEPSCVSVDREFRVCVAVRTADNFYGIFLIHKDQAVASWDAGSPGLGGMFDVRLGDLDQDGSDELVIAEHLMTSNGMAVTYDEIIIVGHHTTAARRSVLFEVQEYCHECTRGTFVRRPGYSGLSIFVTEWLWGVSSVDPKRQPGNYVVGRWFRYSQGKLIQDPGIMVRRYLNSLDAERFHADDSPYSWFLNGKGREVSRDPAVGDGRVISSRSGTVAESDRGYVLQSGNEEIRLKERVDQIGLTSTGRILPFGVDPELLIGPVTGLRARLDAYRDGEEIRHVLWVQPKVK